MGAQTPSVSVVEVLHQPLIAVSNSVKLMASRRHAS